MLQTKREQLFLSEDFSVVLYIYEETVLNDEIVNFTKLKQNVSMETEKLQNCLEKLTNQNIIETKIAYTNNNQVSKCFFVTNEFLGFTQKLHKSVVDKKDFYQTNKKQSNKLKHEQKPDNQQSFDFGRK